MTTRVIESLQHRHRVGEVTAEAIRGQTSGHRDQISSAHVSKRMHFYVQVLYSFSKF
jgi:hypothetical protein